MEQVIPILAVRGVTSTRLSRFAGSSGEDRQKLFVLPNTSPKLVTLRADPAAIQVRFVLLLNLCSDIIRLMRTKMSRAAVMIVLLTCLVCPLVEMFDNWDHTLQTGNDTEYALVVLALCVGVAYSFARFIFKPALTSFVANSLFASCTQKSFFSMPCSFTLLLFDATSPPPLPLRI